MPKALFVRGLQGGRARPWSSSAISKEQVLNEVNSEIADRWIDEQNKKQVATELGLIRLTKWQLEVVRILKKEVSVGHYELLAELNEQGLGKGYHHVSKIFYGPGKKFLKDQIDTHSGTWSLKNPDLFPNTI